MSRFLPERAAGAGPAADREELPRMGFFDHMEELRRRLAVSLVSLFVGFLACWNWAPRLFDFWVEMPPHGLVGAGDYLAGGPQEIPPELGVAGDFAGLIYDYDRVIAASLGRRFAPGLDGRVIRGVMPSWDNTARRGRAAHIAHGANPLRFARWLRELSEHGLGRSYRGELFVNAWNEWAEKAVLEPSAQYGHGYLDALAALPQKPLDSVLPYSPGIVVERPAPVGDYKVPDGRYTAGMVGRLVELFTDGVPTVCISLYLTPHASVVMEAMAVARSLGRVTASGLKTNRLASLTA